MYQLLIHACFIGMETTICRNGDVEKATINLTSENVLKTGRDDSRANAHWREVRSTRLLQQENVLVAYD